MLFTLSEREIPLRKIANQFFLELLVVGSYRSAWAVHSGLSPLHKHCLSAEERSSDTVPIAADLSTLRAAGAPTATPSPHRRQERQHDHPERTKDANCRQVNTGSVIVRGREHLI